jgi:ATP-dependent Clp protease ATP-binding subunit ClpA
VEDNKPLGIYFFVGPSGVGKTELAKKIAKYYFGSEESYIKIDMSEFKEAHSVSKLIGTAPGYVGYDNQTLLIDKIRKQPHSVIILDEIEKAHKDVVNVFFNIFDEGYFYDSKKRKIDFTNSIIIMTSNLGSGNENKNVGFLPYNKGDEEIIKCVKKHFSFEFINRIDEIICFNNLDKNSANEIAHNYLMEYKNKFNFEIDEENFVRDIVDKDELKLYGARYIKRELKKKMLKLLENKIEVY